MTEGLRADVAGGPAGERSVPTGDPLVDEGLQELAEAPRGDLDAQIAAAERLHTTLQTRLADLGRA